MSLIKYSLGPARALNRGSSRNPALAMDPWAEMDWLRGRMNQMFGGSDIGNLTHASAWTPVVNVEEKGDEILLTAELPGLLEEDVELELENNILTISGAKRDVREEGEEGGRYHLVERSFGSFRRSFTLPGAVDSGAISADFEGGLLTVRMPKAPEAKSRKIEVTGKA